MKTLARLARLACLALCWPLAAAAQDAVPLPCPQADSACLFKALHAHPARKLAAWEKLLAEPLVERIVPAPPTLLEYLAWDNAANGYPNRPRRAAPSRVFAAEMTAALAELPREVQLLFANRLAGIALVEDLGGTGYTDVIIDAAGQPVAGYVVLDAGVLERFTANQWVTWKERTPFQPDADWQLDARIEDDARDNRRQAIQYILLHELGHVLSIGRDVHPPWTVQPKEGGPDAAYPFFGLSWRTEGNAYVSHFDDAFTVRRQVSYYFGAKLAGDRMAEAYRQLAKTNFPTLYAAAHPGDDFAESFASYVHVVLMQRPWEIVVRRGGHDEVVFKSCWDEERCRAKRTLLEAIVGKP
ncbi:hypothetical protein [Ramlibacter sp. PS4R-6]|uniref:hypothetical protein n=1 Tax=Ramlibacter sp. PS4R-6 TaxID=3133438 RepID=UPI00309981C4